MARKKKVSQSKRKTRKTRKAKPKRKKAVARSRRAARARKPTRRAAKPRRRTTTRRRTAKGGRRDLLGPPPREAMLMRDDREREAEARLREYTGTSPRLSGGDPDADWQRAISVGEEAVGGSVATPDQSVVDELGAALGVPHAPDEPVRMSAEILERRDRKRSRQPEE
jgi:hypothetical protein